MNIKDKLNSFLSFVGDDTKHRFMCGDINSVTALAFMGVDTNLIENKAASSYSYDSTDIWAVYEFKVPDEDPVFVKFEGYSNSYDGPYYRTWRFVTPRKGIVYE